MGNMVFNLRVWIFHIQIDRTPFEFRISRNPHYRFRLDPLIFLFTLGRYESNYTRKRGGGAQ
mgnify:CR=1 FL=1